VTRSNILNAFRSRMKDILDQWEENNQMFENASESLAEGRTLWAFHNTRKQSTPVRTSLY